MVRDYSRTRTESRIAFRDTDADPSETEGDGVDGSRFSLLEITSGLPDDSREADARAAERTLRDLRGRVKAARAVVARTPSLAETLGSDRDRAARFYARFGITEEMFRRDVPPEATGELPDFAELSRTPTAYREEERARALAVLAPSR